MATRTFILSCVTLCALSLLPSPAAAQWCQDINGAYWCGDPDACEQCGSEGWTCDTYCTTFGGSSTTCGQWAGNPANDLDSDGVANSSDNCLCTPNANQADCDQDSAGDACDNQNVKWVPIESLGWCETDFDTKVWLMKFTIEKYGATRYQNLCGGATCVDKFLLISKSCDWSTTGCGTSASACCTCWFGFEGCTNLTSCGSPSCPF
jgi:hypothetical protein